MKRIAHILVATDLTERSELAIRRALLLQQERAATLTVLHVIEPGLIGEITAHRRNDAETFLRERLAKLPQEARARCAHAVVVGDAFSTIASEAQAFAADLIVLGEPGKYRYPDLFVGTTAERVVRASPIPVLMVKTPPRGSYSRALVAFDLSEGAIQALKVCLTIAPTADVRILHAWRPPLATLAQRHALPEATRKENEEVKALIEHTAKAALAGSAVQGKALSIDMIENNPYVVLRSESGWPDLLAMGTHARGKLETAMIGGLARRMLAETPCDVLMAQP